MSRPTASEVLDAFQAATRLAVELERVPPRRKRKRRRLEAELEEACARAELLRDSFGGITSTPGHLYTVLRATGE